MALIGVALWAGAAQGAGDDDDKQVSPEAAQNYPQPVNVGALIGRTVLQPVASQTILGHVDRIVRTSDGATKFIVDYGGWFGFGGRPIAVALDDVALLGQYVEIIHVMPDQLKTFPTFQQGSDTTLPDADTIKVGLARPSH